MQKGKVRAIALAVILNQGSIFVFEGYDTLEDQTFYRPLGGTIEFGEHSAQTVTRELREEIGAGLTDLKYLGTVENIFTYNGQMGHEIALVYQAAFADPALYATPEMTGREDSGAPFKALWKPLADFQPGGPPLYPDGLLDLLAAR